MKQLLELPVDLFKKIGFSLGSSKYLARSLVEASGINKKENLRVLELGSGHGNVTTEIIASLGSGTEFTALESEECYIAGLEELSQGRFKVIHSSATNLEEHIEDESIDVIISTLPLGSLDKDTVEDILTAAKRSLRTGGTFIQYQYWMVNRKDVKRHFHFEKIRFEPRNFTPACIYITKKL